MSTQEINIVCLVVDRPSFHHRVGWLLHWGSLAFTPPAPSSKVKYLPFACRDVVHRVRPRRLHNNGKLTRRRRRSELGMTLLALVTHTHRCRKWAVDKQQLHASYTAVLISAMCSTKRVENSAFSMFTATNSVMTVCAVTTDFSDLGWVSRVSVNSSMLRQYVYHRVD